MSRSIRKSPFKAIASPESEKEDKRLANRKFRRITKVEINTDREVVSNLREISNVWSFAKDGKHYNPEQVNWRK